MPVVESFDAFGFGVRIPQQGAGLLSNLVRVAASERAALREGARRVEEASHSEEAVLAPDLKDVRNALIHGGTVVGSAQVAD